MLQDIRDRAQGWIAWLLVLFISIPFALWGIHEYLGADPNVPVAEINGDALSQGQFQQAYRQRQAQLRDLFGDGFDLRMLDERELKRSTLNDLIDKEVLLRQGVRDGLRIGDKQLANAILSHRNFQEDEDFSDAKYQQWLRMSGYSADGFEHQYRRALLIGQIQAAIADSALVGKKEIENTIRLQNQKRVVTLLTIPKAHYSDNSITEEAILDYYKNNQTRFVTPERMRVDYLELSLEDLPDVAEPTEEELHALYEDQKADYLQPEQRRARHILIRLDPEADEMAVAVAREKLKEVEKRLEKGDAFEDLAKEYSQDPGSAPQGGDLGFFGVGVMDPQFEAAVYSLVEGEVSEPVRSRFGLHLIELTGIRPSIVYPFEEIRGKLLKDFQYYQKEQRFFDQAEQLANLTFENPDTLAVAAESLGLTIKETGFFDRAGSEDADEETPDEPSAGKPAAEKTTPAEITKNRKFIDGAFAEEVLTNGKNSDPIELGEYRVVVLHRKDHQPPSPKPLEIVRDEVSAILSDGEARKQVTELGRQLLAQLRDGADPVSLGKTHRLTLRESVEIGRRGSEMREVVDRVFRMPHPDGDHKVYDSLVTATGDVIIIALQEVIAKKPAADDTALWNATRDTLANTLGSEEYQAYIRSLRSGVQIRVYENNL